MFNWFFNAVKRTAQKCGIVRKAREQNFNNDAVALSKAEKIDAAIFNIYKAVVRNSELDTPIHEQLPYLSRRDVANKVISRYGKEPTHIANSWFERFRDYYKEITKESEGNVSDLNKDLLMVYSILVYTLLKDFDTTKLVGGDEIVDANIKEQRYKREQILELLKDSATYPELCLQDPRKILLYFDKPFSAEGIRRPMAREFEKLREEVRDRLGDSTAEDIIVRNVYNVVNSNTGSYVLAPIIQAIYDKAVEVESLDAPVSVGDTDEGVEDVGDVAGTTLIDQIKAEDDTDISAEEIVQNWDALKETLKGKLSAQTAQALISYMHKAAFSPESKEPTGLLRASITDEFKRKYDITDFNKVEQDFVDSVYKRKIREDGTTLGQIRDTLNIYKVLQSSLARASKKVGGIDFANLQRQLEDIEKQLHVIQERGELAGETPEEIKKKQEQYKDLEKYDKLRTYSDLVEHILNKVAPDIGKLPDGEEQKPTKRVTTVLKQYLQKELNDVDKEYLANKDRVSREVYEDLLTRYTSDHMRAKIAAEKGGMTEIQSDLNEYYTDKIKWLNHIYAQENKLLKNPTVSKLDTATLGAYGSNILFNSMVDDLINALNVFKNFGVLDKGDVAKYYAADTQAVTTEDLRKIANNPQYLMVLLSNPTLLKEQKEQIFTDIQNLIKRIQRETGVLTTADFPNGLPMEQLDLDKIGKEYAVEVDTEVLDTVNKGKTRKRKSTEEEITDKPIKEEWQHIEQWLQEIVGINKQITVNTPVKEVKTLNNRKKQIVQHIENFVKKYPALRKELAKRLAVVGVSLFDTDPDTTELGDAKDVADSGFYKIPKGKYEQAITFPDEKPVVLIRKKWFPIVDEQGEYIDVLSQNIGESVLVDPTIYQDEDSYYIFDKNTRQYFAFDPETEEVIGGALSQIPQEAKLLGKLVKVISEGLLETYTPTVEEEKQAVSAGFIWNICKQAAAIDEQKLIENPGLEPDYDSGKATESYNEQLETAEEFSMSKLGRVLKIILDKKPEFWEDLIMLIKQSSAKNAGDLIQYLNIFKQLGWDNTDKTLRIFNTQNAQQRNRSYFWKAFKNHIWPILRKNKDVVNTIKTLGAGEIVQEEDLQRETFK
jgi:hypothetical protein